LRDKGTVEHRKKEKTKRLPHYYRSGKIVGRPKDIRRKLGRKEKEAKNTT